MATMMLLGLRVGNETNNNKVAVIMSYQDAELLADKGNLSIDDCLGRLKNMGVAAIVLTDNEKTFSQTETENISRAGLGVILSPKEEMSAATLSDWKTSLKANYPLFLSTGGTVGGLSDSGFTIGLVEDHEQYGPNSIAGYNPLTAKNAMTRVFYLYSDYASRYGVYGYSGAEEIENIFYRAIMDRNVRVLWMTPFTSSVTGEVINNLDEYAKVISDLQQRIEGHSLTIGPAFSTILPSAPNQALLLIAYLGIAAGGMLLLESVISFKKFRWMRYVLYGLAAAVTIAGWFRVPTMTQKMMALAAAIIFPCLAARWLVSRVKLHPMRHGLEAILGEIGLCILACLGITLLGSAFIGGVLSSSAYELVITSFAGVKASQALPLLFVLFITVRELLYQPGESIKKQLRNGVENLKKSGKVLVIMSAVAVVMGILFFVLGTGDSGILRNATSVLRFRNWLENLLPIRPRLKEFLIAWPAMAVGVYLAGRVKRGWSVPFLFLASLGLSSVINTFCHIRASVLVSLERTLIGAFIGLLLGLLAVWLIRLFLQFVKFLGSKP